MRTFNIRYACVPLALLISTAYIAAKGVLPPMETPEAPLTKNTQSFAGAVDAKDQLSKVSPSRYRMQFLMAREMGGTGTVTLQYHTG